MAKDKAPTDESTDTPTAEPTLSDTVAPALPKISASVTEADMAAIRTSTKAALDREPKVTLRIPATSDPKALNFETVCINGYIYQIKRGVDVLVPAPVKQLLIDAGLI